MLAGIHPHRPGLKIVLVEFFAELHRIHAGQGARIVQGVVIVQGQIVVLLLVDRNAEFLRVPHHRRMAIGHKVEELHRMDHRLIVDDELAGLQRLVSRLAWEAVEGHHMVPDPRLGRLMEVVLDHALLGMLVHEVQHPLVRRLHPIIKGAAAGLRGKIPNLLVLQRLFKPDQRRPLDPDVLVHQQLRDFLEQGRRIRLIGEEEMAAGILVPQRLDLFNHLLGRHTTILVEVALAMVAEGAAAPITAARREVGNDQLRHEVFLQRQPFEIRQGQSGRLLRIDFGTPVHA